MYACLGNYRYTSNLFYPVPRSLAHHTTEIKYQRQRNPKHVCRLKKANSTTVQPTYCPSFKNRFLWLVVTCSFLTPFPVGLIPTMPGGLQVFLCSFWWFTAALLSKKWNTTNYIFQKAKLINIYLAPTRFTGLFQALKLGTNVTSTHVQIGPCPVQG